MLNHDGLAKSPLLMYTIEFLNGENKQIAADDLEEKDGLICFQKGCEQEAGENPRCDFDILHAHTIYLCQANDVKEITSVRFQDHAEIEQIESLYNQRGR